MDDDEPPAAGGAAVSFENNGPTLNMAPIAEPAHRANPGEVPAL